MSKLPQISGQELVRALKRDGWEMVSQRDSHLKMAKMLPGWGKKQIVIIPMHKTIKKGTLSAILKDANLTVDHLKEIL